MEHLLLPDNKIALFASDFHFGAKAALTSAERERLVVQWLSSYQDRLGALFLLGDQFDFWFEYKKVAPKGYLRFLGKLAELKDSGVDIYMFTGNHDMWMFDYFQYELEIPVYRQPTAFSINNQHFLLGHGDGLGPGDTLYKLLKKIFANKLAQRLFALLPPAIGFGIAEAWSGKSRGKHIGPEQFSSLGNERLLSYCKQVLQQEKYDYLIFGHRHLPLDIEVNKSGYSQQSSRYINTGEWLHYNSYALFDGESLQLQYFRQEQLRGEVICLS